LKEEKVSSLFPEGLTQKEFDLLSKCSGESANVPLSDLLKEAEEHLDKVEFAYQKNTFVNYRLAQEIFACFQTVIKLWDSLPGFSYPWLRGMMRYFFLSSDLENDFSSPIGFEDDADIVNACLRLAGREDLCINPEDFDDV
jgi:hypothetical protein